VEGTGVMDRGAGWRWCLVLGNDGDFDFGV